MGPRAKGQRLTGRETGRTVWHRQWEIGHLHMGQSSLKQTTKWLHVVLRPIIGISLELAALSGFLAPWYLVPGGILQVLYLLAAQSLATYLIHCPAHYLVGRSLGIRFRKLRVGKTTLARALPDRFASLARHLPILTLSADKASLGRSSATRARTMYLSGVVASCASAVVLAVSVTFSGDLVLAAVAWAFALGYLVFDAVFSPKSGDVARARKV